MINRVVKENNAFRAKNFAKKTTKPHFNRYLIFNIPAIISFARKTTILKYNFDEKSWKSLQNYHEAMEAMFNPRPRCLWLL